METNATTPSPRDLPKRIRTEDLGPHLRRVYLAGRILTLGEVLQLPRNEGLPSDRETVLGTLAPRPYRTEPDASAPMPLHEALVETDGGLEVYVILADTESYYGATPEELRLSRQAVYDAPRILLSEWTAPAEAQA